MAEGMVNYLNRVSACIPRECSFQTIHDVAYDILAMNNGRIDNAFDYLC
jgi:hypothetical protein